MGGKKLQNFSWNKVTCNSLGMNGTLGQIIVYFYNVRALNIWKMFKKN